jgi:CO/xanthine dehydrogenase Mo-binding subunit
MTRTVPGSAPSTEIAAAEPVAPAAWWSRREDVRLLTGTASFTGDVNRHGQLHLRVVRSQEAHGLLRGIDTTAALAVPGVVRILTGADLEDVPRIPLRILTRPQLEGFRQPVLAVDKVRYVGEPVAVVVARSPALAEDAADLVEVDISPLPAVVDPTGPREVPVWDHAEDDVLCTFVGRDGDVDDELRGADVVVTEEFSTGRDTGLPLETRGLVAEWADGGRRLDLWGPVKFLKFTRMTVAGWFGIDPEAVTCHHVDVGGMFGPRGEVYPEDFLVPWAASVVGAPVKWVEDVNEHLQSINHSRGQRHRVTAAARASGELVALRVDSVVDYGAYARPIAGRVAELVVEGLPGPYRWGSLDLTCRAVATNKTPAGTMRGPSTFDTTFARERVLDLIAAGVGLDPVELRRRNLITAAELPYVQSFGGGGGGGSGGGGGGGDGGLATGQLPAGGPGSAAVAADPPMHDATYDSGDYHLVLDRLLEHVDVAALEEEISRRRGDGELVGYGLGCFLDHSGLGREESIRLDLVEGGRFRYITTASEIGQGLASMIAKVGAEALGVEESAVDVATNDTSEYGAGNGTFASRSTIFVGSAALDAARQLREAAQRELGAAENAARAPDWARMTPRTVIGRHESAQPTFGFGAHLAVVSLDPGTLHVTVERLVVAYDCGRAIDIDSVRGQLVGAAIQALGGTLFQELTFDAGGQPQSTTFLDFLVPTLGESLPVETVILELPGTVSNPLGVKGAGEAGVMGVGAAVANALSAAVDRPSAVTRLPVRPDDLLPFVPQPMGELQHARRDVAGDVGSLPRTAAVTPFLRRSPTSTACWALGAAVCAVVAARLIERMRKRSHD